MKVKKISSIIDTSESKGCNLNRKLRQNKLMSEIKKRERNISQQNQKMFQRLVSIVSRPNPLNCQSKGPNSLNFDKRRSEMKRIMKSNVDILNNIRKAKPALSIKELQKRFHYTEKYKTIASSYDEYGKKEDPVERLMHQVYYDASSSPRRRVAKGPVSTSFKPRVKRHGSIDNRGKRWAGSNVYSGARSFQYTPSRDRSGTNRDSMLPSIGDFKEKFISVDQFNSMKTNEMADIRKFKKGKKKGFSSVQQVLQIHGPSGLGNASNTSMHMI
ncbi:unnamed protein product [Moneuplotes crassus]|uniref:Uncharacterized protein n=1 Tax=Euplotes crassus TaxID=5936 RepID=A0AAD2D0F1_EUPCR|nr:unnamed protein product [Moneuplotes crassus]